MHDIHRIGIIGDGGWGTTLAILCARQGFRVTLWGAFPSYIKTLKKTRINTKFLPGVRIPPDIALSHSLDEVVSDAQLIVLAVPSRYALSVIKKLRKYDFSKKAILSVIKGIEAKSLLRISQIIERELCPMAVAALSGPTIAAEVARGIPSTAVITAKNMRIARSLQNVFNSPTFRIYTNPDIVGVELGGSIKNIIAIACGACDGLGLGTNTKAAILSRGLAEMARLGVACGARARTFAGLSGLGDLVTTCFSPQSRNRFVGEQIGRGKPVRAVIGAMDMVAEGVTTVAAIVALSKKHNIVMPITAEVYNIIYRGKKPRAAVTDLMNRKLKNE